MRKLTKQQKKKYVKRGRLKKAVERVDYLSSKLADITFAINKLPEGVRQDFVRSAGIEREMEAMAMMDDIDKKIRDFAVSAVPVILRARGVYMPGESELKTPDEIDKDKQF